jgi:hypothetical protein
MSLHLLNKEVQNDSVMYWHVSNESGNPKHVALTEASSGELSNYEMILQVFKQMKT